jgi:DNA-binding response OmpR family regulator
MSTRDTAGLTRSVPDIRGRMALVADGSQHTGELFARSLRHAGVGVLVAHSSPAALDHLAICRFDLVILDLELPIGRAFRVLESLQADARHAETRVIVVASACDPADRWLAMLSGATTFLTKPVRSPQLLATVAALLPYRPPMGIAVGV